MRSPLLPLRPPNPPHRLEDYYHPKTPEERAGLAFAYARRDTNRQFRRVLGKIDRLVADMKAQNAARRRRRGR